MRVQTLSVSGLGDGQAVYSAGGTIPPTNSPCYVAGDWLPHLLGYAGADENACLARPENQPTIPLTQDLSTATSPGLPVVYDPYTGLIADSNTTGATAPPAISYGAAASAASQGVPNCSSELASCTTLGIACQNAACGNLGGTPALTGTVLAIVCLLGGYLLLKDAF